MLMDSETVLVIDDNPTNLDVLYTALDSAGYKVFVATDGESGIEQALEHPPDLILLDVQMPGIDGFETCLRLKSVPSTQDIPIVFMTALADTEAKVKGLNAGAIDYITKPFQHQEVIARIRVHLKVRQLSLELTREKQQLEQRVIERTTQLSQAFNELKNAQLQLVQSEKMSALGNLVAGVAHEINNPVGSVAGNLKHAEDYLQGLLEHLHLYQHYYPQPVSAIQDHSEEIDLPFLLEDLPSLITSMKAATERIAGISTSLRTFSRADSQHPVKCNIHDGIESTLLVLKYRLKANQQRPEITIVKHYGDLPEVECYPGQLNQVFMNILANAIDAIDEITQDPSRATSHGYSIEIHTEVLTDRSSIAIHIKDNALGMPEAVRAKIFDHLFTTKSAGKGTGLGLSIARQIVEETHQGLLTCRSTLGEGTAFMIQIPLS
ncbi:hybrid sensor histidine kinase/response regulator [Leptolyngbya sp. AN03gr2]|uniref:hybrid sensor histidine kinase/response regulator n=1 Tax=unclassified Leptolyngbya TaxID=2650499 RepID=UPI003D3117A7